MADEIKTPWTGAAGQPMSEAELQKIRSAVDTIHADVTKLIEVNCAELRKQANVLTQVILGINELTGIIRQYLPVPGNGSAGQPAGGGTGPTRAEQILQQLTGCQTTACMWQQALTAVQQGLPGLQAQLPQIIANVRTLIGR